MRCLQVPSVYLAEEGMENQGKHRWEAFCAPESLLDIITW